jgi:hypothetical protein
VTKKIAIGLFAAGVVLGSVVYASSVTQHTDPCPSDRDLFKFGLTSDDSTYKAIEDAAVVAVEDSPSRPMRRIKGQSRQAPSRLNLTCRPVE